MRCAALGVTVYLMLHLQQVLDLKPLLAGLLLVATGLGSPLLSPLTGRLTDQGAARRLMAVGVVVAALALGCVALGAGLRNWPVLLCGFLVFGLGPPLVHIPSSAVAAGLTVEARQLGATLGISVLGFLLTAVEWAPVTGFSSAHTKA